MKIRQAEEQRDEHIRRMMHWHFSDDTGSPYWLEKKRELSFDPLTEIDGLDDVVEKFPLFDSAALKTTSIDRWKPKGFPKTERFSMYQTGGTTGSPSRRLGRRGMNAGESDFADDYIEFSKHLPKEGFQQGGRWLYLGPNGPRRLQRGVEVLANQFNADFIGYDMDAGWVKNPKNPAQPEYTDHLVASAIAALRRDKPTEVFCPPILIQRIGETFDWANSGVRGVFAGGTAMPPQTVRFISEELFQGKVTFYPAYGNALVGLARSRPFATMQCPIDGQNPYQIYYQPQQPSTIVRVTKKGAHHEVVDYGDYGYLETSAFTTEWCMPRNLELRDFGQRIAPNDDFPWDGFSDVQLPEELKGSTNVGVY